MRSTWLILFLFLLPYLSNGQESYGQYTNYFSVEGGFLASSSGLGFVPSFSYYRGGHKIDAGLNITMYDIWKDGPGILGTYLGYKFYPNKRKNMFNLYFGYTNLFDVHNRGKKYPKIYDEVSDRHLLPTNVYLLENMVGMGFDCQMGNRFYMFSDFNVGVVLDWSEYKETPTEMEIRSTGMIRIGLAYNVAWKQPK
ncbi:MAG: hypothetical protein GC178_12960 [Flavobacteriales bacterium]|nr:hypothetical protein [Flavobacteriales bacterium]